MARVRVCMRIYILGRTTLEALGGGVPHLWIDRLYFAGDRHSEGFRRFADEQRKSASHVPTPGIDLVDDNNEPDERQPFGG